jgi:hypothetical protein
VRFFASEVACARPGGSPSFPLAPSASRSRLKLRRGTDAFRGNGTPAEWTNRQAFGHFSFSDLLRGSPMALWERTAGFSRCVRFSARRSTCVPPGGGPRFPFAPDAESDADEAPPGCWKSSGTTARRQGLRSDRIAFGATRFLPISGGRS